MKEDMETILLMMLPRSSRNERMLSLADNNLMISISHHVMS